MRYSGAATGCTTEALAGTRPIGIEAATADEEETAMDGTLTVEEDDDEEDTTAAVAVAVAALEDELARRGREEDTD